MEEFYSLWQDKMVWPKGGWTVEHREGLGGRQSRVAASHTWCTSKRYLHYFSTLSFVESCQTAPGNLGIGRGDQEGWRGRGQGSGPSSGPDMMIILRAD